MKERFKFLGEGCNIVVGSKNFTDNLKRLSEEKKIKLVEVDVESDRELLERLVSKADVVIAATDERRINEDMLERKRDCGFDWTTPINLNETDRKLLQLLQDDFPLVERPWKVVGDKLSISEDEVVTHLKRLYEGGVIQKIGPILDAPKIGLTASTLVAMKVSENRVDDVASVINEYESVSHNYEREHEYNIWFTITASDTKELTTILEEIRRKAGIKKGDILNIPIKRRFKIDVRFQL
ncbi:MAG: AsnC family transcriptional regulator [Candidatus Bathyarchaeia archaeon]